MENIYLRIMTRELCHEFFRNFKNDSDIFMDMNLFSEYKYDKSSVDKYFDSKQSPDRIMYAIMKDDKPIGELQLKNIDQKIKSAHSVYICKMMLLKGMDMVHLQKNWHCSTLLTIWG